MVGIAAAYLPALTGRLPGSYRPGGEWAAFTDPRRSTAMLSYRRIAVTAAAVATLAAPAAAQARPDIQAASEAKIDKVSPDARYGVPDETTPTFISVPQTEVVEADGFVWGDALIGGGAALLLTAVVGGAAVAIRPRQSAAH
jgi:hypothetical protein